MTARARQIAADALIHTHTYRRTPFDTYMEAVNLLAGWVADAMESMDPSDEWALEYTRDRARARRLLKERSGRMMARRQREKAARFGTEDAS